MMDCVEGFEAATAGAGFDTAVVALVCGAGVAVEAAGAMVMRNAVFAREVRVELIELKKRFDVVADETDGHDHQVLHASAREPFDFVFEVWSEPGQFAVAGLKRERPGVRKIFGNRGHRAGNVAGIGIAAVDYFQR